jgi:hypothetical protein
MQVSETTGSKIMDTRETTIQISLNVSIFGDKFCSPLSGVCVWWGGAPS